MYRGVVDWAGDHHDVALIDQDGALLAKARLGDDADGLAALLRLSAEQGDDPHRFADARALKATRARPRSPAHPADNSPSGHAA